MTKHVGRRALCLWTALIWTGCVSTSKLHEVERELDQTKVELDDLKNSPGKLLSEAKQAFAAQEFWDCKTNTRNIMERYPGTSEAHSAKELLWQARERISAIDAENARREEAEEERKRREAAHSETARQSGSPIPVNERLSHDQRRAIAADHNMRLRALELITKEKIAESRDETEAWRSLQVSVLVGTQMQNEVCSEYGITLDELQQILQEEAFGSPLSGW